MTFRQPSAHVWRPMIRSLRGRLSKHDIILLTGEGSIQMNIQELQTIIHHKMPIKIFLINNGGYPFHPPDPEKLLW